MLFTEFGRQRFQISFRRRWKSLSYKNMSRILFPPNAAGMPTGLLPSHSRVNNKLFLASRGHGPWRTAEIAMSCTSCPGTRSCPWGSALASAGLLDHADLGTASWIRPQMSFTGQLISLSETCVLARVPPRLGNGLGFISRRCHLRAGFCLKQQPCSQLSATAASFATFTVPK